MRATLCGAPVSCRACIRGLSFAVKAIRYCFCPIRQVSTRRPARIIDSIQPLNQDNWPTSAIRKSPRASVSMKWRFACRRSVPELMDFSREPEHILEMYGATPGKASFANNCLLARRLVERGVRFVQLFDQGWDHHSGVFDNLPRKCQQVDRPIAALITDLKQRGLLDDTLVVWGAEFGRTPMLQGQDGEPPKKPAAIIIRTPSAFGSPAAASKAARPGTNRRTGVSTHRRFHPGPRLERHAAAPAGTRSPAIDLPVPGTRLSLDGCARPHYR